MIDRLSVNALLKSVIGILAAVVVVILALDAWDSWKRLNTANRSAAVAEASSHLFTALHNLRVDRASSFRDLSADRQFTHMNQQIRDARTAEMPALKTIMVALEAIDFAERQSFVAGIAQATTKLAALHEESTPAFLRPKAERRPGLAQDVFNQTMLSWRCSTRFPPASLGW